MTPACIVIVEDEIIIARDIESIVSRMGHDVVDIATNGDDALQSIVDKRPDLVLMDVMLNGRQTGIDVAGDIASAYQIPVIFITAHTDPDTLSKMKEAKPYGYIAKPFDAAEIKAAIEIALYRRQFDAEFRQVKTDLSIALDRIDLLHKLLPLCPTCNGRQDNDFYWDRVRDYLSAYPELAERDVDCRRCHIARSGDCAN